MLIVGGGVIAGAKRDVWWWARMINSPFLADDYFYQQGYARGKLAAEFKVAVFCKDTNPYCITMPDGITYPIDQEQADKWDLGWEHGYNEYRSN